MVNLYVLNTVLLLDWSFQHITATKVQNTLNQLNFGQETIISNHHYSLLWNTKELGLNLKSVGDFFQDGCKTEFVRVPAKFRTGCYRINAN